MTADKLIEKVRELAKERPLNQYRSFDGVSNTAHYLHGVCVDQSKGCIFGQALLALGVAREHLECNVPIRGILQRMKIKATATELLWLELVQLAQDRCDCWHDAVIEADLKSGLRRTAAVPPDTRPERIFDMHVRPHRAYSTKLSASVI